MKAYGVGGQPLYLKVYEYYKEQIEDGRLPPGARMPSIRKCACQLAVSRTTAQSAYFQLAADGYLVPRPRSGYYVTDLAAERAAAPAPGPAQAPAPARYDFVSMAVDEQSFDFALWSRYVKSALRQSGNLLSYGEPQGEPELRRALCGYVREQRAAVCDEEQIVVGAGVQSLLHLLCPLLPRGQSYQFEGEHFPQGAVVLHDHGLTPAPREQAGLLYVMPSRITRRGGMMTTQQRLALLEQARGRGQLLLEDDYDNEFCYFTRPTPSLQGLAGGEGVVYLGTFSRLLVPSLRLSFLILPPSLLPAYRRRRDWYNQTVPKTEQMALCQFIRDGRLQAQARRLRRLYLRKSGELVQTLAAALPAGARAAVGERGPYVHLQLPAGVAAARVAAAARERGVRVRPVAEDALLLGCTAVHSADFPAAARRLAAAVESQLER